MLKIIKGMAFKEKLGYIWEYYKLQIIIIIIAVAMLFSIIDRFLNPRPDTYISVSFLGGHISSEKIYEFQEYLNENFVPADINAEALVNNFYTSSDPELDMALQVKLTTMLMSSGIDVIISSDEEFERLKGQGSAFYNLGSLLTDAADYGSQIIENGEVVGLKVNKSDILDKLQIDYKNKIFCIYINSNKIEEASGLIKYLVN
ncbi:MAG: hypothetical protein LBV08_07420 [Clostridiales bacterium]|nr:hypothetical protein [Clostridiales bacterium]